MTWPPSVVWQVHLGYHSCAVTGVGQSRSSQNAELSKVRVVKGCASGKSFMVIKVVVVVAKERWVSTAGFRVRAYADLPTAACPAREE